MPPSWGECEEASGIAAPTAILTAPPALAAVSLGSTESIPLPAREVLGGSLDADGVDGAGSE